MSQVRKVCSGIEDVLARKRNERHTGCLVIITRVQMQQGGVRSIKTEATEVMK